MFCNILAYLPPLMSLSVENTTWKNACAVTVRIAKWELLWGSGWKWGRQGFIIVLLQVRNSRHLKINKWASIVFTLLGFLPATGKTFKTIGRNWNEFGKHMPSVEARLPDHLEAVWSCLGLLGSRGPQGGVEGSPPQGSLYCSSVPRRLFCSSLSLWLWGTGGVNTKSFPFLFWVHYPNSFLLWLPGLGPRCWLILPGFRQPSFTLQAADFIPPASPNRAPHWRARGERGPKRAFTLHRVW